MQRLHECNNLTIFLSHSIAYTYVELPAWFIASESGNLDLGRVAPPRTRAAAT